MQPILIIVLATAASVPLGLWLRHNLATLKYRKVDEQDLPDPGPRWWVVWTSVIAIGSLAAAATMSHNLLAFIPLIPLAVAGPWLAAVDFDVLRIPNRVLAPTAAATLIVVVGIAAAAREWAGVLVPIASGLLAGGVFAAVHLATKGGIGFGDAKLAGAIALAVGPLGAATAWVSIFTGSLAALAWNMSTRRSGPVAYGPWLLCGACVAAIASALGV